LYTPKSTGGRIFVILSYIISIAVAIWMGFFFIDFANTWPDWGPGLSPSLFVWIPFAIAGFITLMLLVQILRMVNERDESKQAQHSSTQAHSYDDARPTSTETSGYIEPEPIYETPPFCSQCGASLDSELVEWVGPLRFKCPTCGKIGKAERIQD
jgi:predicted RNA-binding Zn-ribbon protein involved in translation (DUF1610 family)